MMKKTRWKTLDHDIESDMVLLVFRDELKDLVEIMKMKIEKNLISDNISFVITAELNGLIKFSNTLMTTPIERRKNFKAVSEVQVSALKEVYRLLGIKY